jgi:predicted phosphodiesterase
MAAKKKTDANDDSEVLTAVEKENIKLKTQNSQLRSERNKTQKEIAQLEEFLGRFSAIKSEDQKVPRWMRPKKAKKIDRRATPILLLSDLHLDEVVDEYEMDGVNCYDRDVAHERLERVVNATTRIAHDYVSGLDLEGIVVAMLGDVITGEIHEELAHTNEAPVAETIRHWVPHLASALTFLADEFGAVHVPCVDGNHDRAYKNIPSKRRAYSSNGWIIYNWIADLVRHDDRITFGITPSPEQILPVYDKNFLLVHGDGFRTAGGVGGIYPSLLKYLLRKTSIGSQTGTPVDHTCMGHWHQLNFGPEFTVNGSLKGWDEYARGRGFGYERPQQALFLVTPENGITMRLPVFAE